MPEVKIGFIHRGLSILQDISKLSFSTFLTASFVAVLELELHIPFQDMYNQHWLIPHPLCVYAWDFCTSLQGWKCSLQTSLTFAHLQFGIHSVVLHFV